MRPGVAVAGLVCLLALLQNVNAQYNYNYDLNYYDDYEVYSAGYSYDFYDENYDDGFYFDPYTGYYDDVYGDYFFDDFEEVEQDCRLTDAGTFSFNGSGTAPCDVKVSGADKHVESMRGGLDGIYKVHSCENGRPLYKRENSPEAEERVLWYSAQFRDWDITNGSKAQEDDILMYGGGGGRESRPQHVKEQWNLASDFKKDFTGTEDYFRADVSVMCADGSEVDMPQTTHFGKVPFLTDDEMEAQYKLIYQRARRSDPSADVNLGLVTVFVMVGLGIVFGLPYLVSRNRRSRRGGKGNEGALNSIVEAARKRGHSA